MNDRKNADRGAVERILREAYSDLGSSGYAEFGDEVRIALVGTTAMYLHDAGYEVDDRTRRIVAEIAREYAGTGESR